MSMPEDPSAQTRDVSRTVERSLGEAGFVLGDIVRQRITAAEAAHMEAAAPVCASSWEACSPPTRRLSARWSDPK